MEDIVTLFRKWRTVILLLIAILLIVLNLDKISVIRSHSVDRKNYAAVAVDFIKTSGFIGQRLGKVTSVSHFGVGGAGGKESYNVFRIRGEDRAGIITITLIRNDEGKWYVTTADLTVEGIDYEVPVSRSVGEKWRRFKMK